MNKTHRSQMAISAACILISIFASCRLFAQNDDNWYTRWQKMTRTEQVFSMLQPPNIQDFVSLQNTRIIFELNNVSDYERLKNLDSILMKLSRDISFYKDSLSTNNNENVSIDYYIPDTLEYRQIRFVRHPTDGDLYIKKHGETSKLKIEQDTVRILMHVTGNGISTYVKGRRQKKVKRIFRPTYKIQVTFCLNNYTDIDKLAANPELLHHIMDTLMSTKSARTVAKAYKHPSTTFYAPYSANRYSDFRQYPYIMDANMTALNSRNYRKSNFGIDANLGGSLVRNTITPYAEMGILFRDSKYVGNGHAYDVFRLYMSSYFFFNEGSPGNYTVNDNWFLNFDVGSPNDNDRIGNNVVMMSIGAGYLVISNGNYFSGTTMKLFMNLQFNKKGITISPEIISTNNFKQFFPGLTVKVF